MNATMTGMRGFFTKVVLKKRKVAMVLKEEIKYHEDVKFQDFSLRKSRNLKQIYFIIYCTTYIGNNIISFSQVTNLKEISNNFHQNKKNFYFVTISQKKTKKMIIFIQNSPRYFKQLKLNG